MKKTNKRAILKNKYLSTETIKSIRMKNLIGIILTVLLLTAYQPSLRAQGHHEHHSSHEHKSEKLLTSYYGGKVQQSGKYFIEMVHPQDASKKIMFYVIDKNGKSINQLINIGFVSIMDIDGKIENLELKRTNSDGFYLSKEILTIANLSLRFELGRKVISTTFYFDKNFTEELDQKYVCPMHSEVSLDKPGKCPKCNMNLVLKE